MSAHHERRPHRGFSPTSLTLQERNPSRRTCACPQVPPTVRRTIVAMGGLDSPEPVQPQSLDVQLKTAGVDRARELSGVTRRQLLRRERSRTGSGQVREPGVHQFAALTGTSQLPSRTHRRPTEAGAADPMTFTHEPPRTTREPASNRPAQGGLHSGVGDFGWSRPGGGPPTEAQSCACRGSCWPAESSAALVSSA
jgi:hypothetical protein